MTPVARRPLRAATLAALLFGTGLAGTVNGIGAGYTGSLSGSGLTGAANGTFFGNLPGNPPTETGGNFALRGPAYLASGIFAGHR